jgi:molybdate transport system permease protein
MLALLALPVLALLFGSSPTEILAGLKHPLFAQALGLSAKTTIISLFIVVVAGTPLAWWLATGSHRQTRVVELFVDLPIVLPPAVVGIALLQVFGHSGLFGSLQIPFTTTAVVLAQVVVSAPFYIQATAAAFRRIDEDLILVARTLGQSPRGTFFRVVAPIALPGMIGGAALAWARAIGEFGATLLFAGNLPGVTQTMPLAIYTALESDLRIALALSLVLAGIAVVLLFGLRMAPAGWRRRTAAAHEPPTGGPS